MATSKSMEQPPRACWLSMKAKRSAILIRKQLWQHLRRRLTVVVRVFSFIGGVINSAFDMLGTSSSWMILSFFIAGLLHEFLSPEKMRKSSIGTKKVSGVFWSTISGALIPICSCGTIPLGISLYYSGAYLGPTLAFNDLVPMINPIAVILSWGLLGPKITIIYIITGLVAPMIIGIRCKPLWRQGNLPVFGGRSGRASDFAGRGNHVGDGQN